MGKQPLKHILIALDLGHLSGREHLDGFYRYADKKQNWKIDIIPGSSSFKTPAVRQILSEGIDGVIVKDAGIPRLMDAFPTAQLPIVVVDQPNVSPCRHVQVCCDNANIGRAAAQFFASLGRFASYGFVPDPYNCIWSQERGKAFCCSIIAQQKNAFVSTAVGNFSEWLTTLPKPAAVFAAFDNCGRQVLECCRELRIKVPREVVVLGVDDDPLICEHCKPKLSSIHPDHVEQGFAAAQELDRLMSAHKTAKRRTVICPHLDITERDSTAVVPPAIHLVREATAYLAAHAFEGIRVSDVIRHLNVSPRLANLRYSQATGHSIRDELVRRRLSEAKRLLEKTNYSIGLIARKCGFRSAIVLTHLFNAHLGMSPSDWRKKAPSSLRAQFAQPNRRTTNE